MPTRDSSAAPDWVEAFAQRISLQRDRLQAAAAAGKARTQELEKNLQAQLAAIEAALQETSSYSKQREADISSKLALLKSDEQRLTAQEADLEQHRTELATLRQNFDTAQQDQLARQQSLLDGVTASLAQLQEQRAVLERDCLEHAAAQAKVAAERQACDEFQKQLVKREELMQVRLRQLEELSESATTRDQLLTQREAAAQQRQTAISERESGFSQREAELSRRETEVTRREADIKLSEQRTRSQRASVAQELRSRRLKLLAELERQRLESSREAAGESSTASAELSQARLEVARLQANEESLTHKHLEMDDELATAKRELQQMHKQLEEAESRPASGGGPEADDLRKRLDMALADVRDLKTRNVELADQVTKAKSASAAPTLGAAGGEDNWETRKQRMLAQLESDFDEDNSDQKAAKLTIEDAIRRTEEAMAAKNNEVAELKRLLSEQSGNIGGVAIGAAAIAEMLDTDELVRQERDSLRELQEKLREQLKQAEIDISMERAKIARERADLDEKLHEFEQRKPAEPAGTTDEASKGKTGGNRNRWLQRLGLGGSDEQK